MQPLFNSKCAAHGYEFEGLSYGSFAKILCKVMMVLADHFMLFWLITGLGSESKVCKLSSCRLLYLNLSFALSALLTIAVVDTKAAPRQAPAEAVFR